MKRNGVISIALAAMFAMTSATAFAHYDIQVNLWDGEPVRILITDGKTLTVDGDKLIIGSENDRAEFMLENVKHINYAETTGIESIENTGEMPTLKIEDRQIIVSTNKPCKCLVCDASGAVVMNLRVEGETRIDLMALHAGVYFVKAGSSQAIKVMIR